MSTIEVRALRFAYARGPERLKGVDLTVDSGDVLVIDGPSGGGKSTLLRALCGLIPHFHGGTISGHVRIGSVDPVESRPGEVARHTGYLFQDPEAQIVFDVVRTDVAFGPRAEGWRTDEIEGTVEEALAACGISHLADRQTRTLSGGERQRVALAGLVARAPGVLLLDEPSAQLDAAGVSELVEVLTRIRHDNDITLVVADHHPEYFLDLAPRRLSMRAGVLGDSVDRASRSAPGSRPGPCPAGIEAQALTCSRDGRKVLMSQDFRADIGRVTVVEGPNGCGKSTLLRALAGLDVPDAGAVLVQGHDVTADPIERRFPHVVFIAQSSRNQMLTESVRDELAFGLSRAGFDPAGCRDRVASVATELDLDDLLDCHPLDLSVGQREQAALASGLAVNPTVLLLDEPTRALDPVRADALARLLRRYADAGTAVVVATHDRLFSDAVADARVVLGTAPRAGAAAA